MLLIEISCGANSLECRDREVKEEVGKIEVFKVSFGEVMLTPPHDEKLFILLIKSVKTCSHICKGFSLSYGEVGEGDKFKKCNKILQVTKLSFFFLLKLL